MGQTKELNIKKQRYYFFDDMIGIKSFHSNLLNINKKSHGDVDIYYIGYITIKKFSDYENSHSVNPSYLIIYSATEYFKEKCDEKYLIVDSTEKYEEVFSGIITEIKRINGGEKVFCNKKYTKIGVNTGGKVPLNKKLKFPTLTIIIRCILQNGKKLYPQIYLDEYLYES